MPVADMVTETDEHEKTDDQKHVEGAQDTRPLSMILLSHPKPSASPAHAHFPTLVHLSILRDPTNTSTAQNRLIPLASSADARLASALHIPRVGALAIFADAPGAKALEDFVRDNVDVTECNWVDEAMKAEWQGLNVKSEVTAANAIKKQHGKKDDKAKAPKHEQTTKNTETATGAEK